jgi:hypothetical protein
MSYNLTFSLGGGAVDECKTKEGGEKFTAFLKQVRIRLD